MNDLTNHNESHGTDDADIRSYFADLSGRVDSVDVAAPLGATTVTDVVVPIASTRRRRWRATGAVAAAMCLVAGAAALFSLSDDRSKVAIAPEPVATHLEAMGPARSPLIPLNVDGHAAAVSEEDNRVVELDRFETWAGGNVGDVPTVISVLTAGDAGSFSEFESLVGLMSVHGWYTSEFENPPIAEVGGVEGVSEPASNVDLGPEVSVGLLDMHLQDSGLRLGVVGIDTGESVSLIAASYDDSTGPALDANELVKRIALVDGALELKIDDLDLPVHVDAAGASIVESNVDGADARVWSANQVVAPATLHHRFNNALTIERGGSDWLITLNYQQDMTGGDQRVAFGITHGMATWVIPNDPTADPVSLFQRLAPMGDNQESPDTVAAPIGLTVDGVEPTEFTPASRDVASLDRGPTIRTEMFATAGEVPTVISSIEFTGVPPELAIVDGLDVSAWFASGLDPGAVSLTGLPDDPLPTTKVSEPRETGAGRLSEIVTRVTRNDTRLGRSIVGIDDGEQRRLIVASYGLDGAGSGGAALGGVSLAERLEAGPLDLSGLGTSIVSTTTLDRLHVETHTEADQRRVITREKPASLYALHHGPAAVPVMQRVGDDWVAVSIPLPGNPDAMFAQAIGVSNDVAATLEVVGDATTITPESLVALFDRLRPVPNSEVGQGSSGSAPAPSGSTIQVPLPAGIDLAEVAVTSPLDANGLDRTDVAYLIEPGRPIATFASATHELLTAYDEVLGRSDRTPRYVPHEGLGSVAIEDVQEQDDGRRITLVTWGSGARSGLVAQNLTDEELDVVATSYGTELPSPNWRRTGSEQTPAGFNVSTPGALFINGPNATIRFVRHSHAGLFTLPLLSRGEVAPYEPRAVSATLERTQQGLVRVGELRSGPDGELRSRTCIIDGWWIEDTNATDPVEWCDSLEFVEVPISER